MVKTSMQNKHGFSLLELMLVLTLISLLACMGYITAQSLIVHARRLDGQTALFELALSMEQYYAQHHTYENATLATHTNTDVLSTDKSKANWYQLAITTATATTFTIIAIPLASQATQDHLCQTLTLNHLGVKNIQTGPIRSPTGTIAQCWS